MSQFEYVAIPISLVLTFGVARLLSGFPHVVIAQRAYWVHAVWCVTALLNLFLFWWAFWSASATAEWTLGLYLWTLLYPALCYVGATLLVPSDASAEPDWRAYYFRIRKPWFALACVANLTTIGTLSVVASTPVLSAEVLLTTAFIALYVLGYLSDREAIQRVVVLLNLAFVLAAYAPLVWRPLGV